ncbi:MAG: MFS transporter [Bauldia sp.]|nr:MFS transporter [Bauldia sp.]
MLATIGSVASLLVGLAFLIAGHGLQLTLIPLRATAEGWTPFEIGVIGSAYYVGFVAGCLVAPHVILRAGHIRAFAALVSLCSAVTLLQAIFVAVAPWILFRMLVGATLAGLYMINESWLNDRAANENRGTIMGVYIAVNFAAITVGQLMVGLGSPTSFTLFAVASVAISLAAIPVALTTSAQPAPLAVARLRPKELYAASPVGLVGVTVVGIANGAFWALAAVYAVGEGLDDHQVAIFTGLATVSGAVAQWPIGRISDRIDRRIVLATLLALAACVGLALAFLPIAGGLWIPLAVAFGLVTFPTYSVAAAHAYDFAPAGGHVATAAGLLLANGFGAIIGPILAAALMEATTTAMLFVFTAFAQCGLALFAIARMRTRATLPATEKVDFDLAATAPMGTVIPPEPLDPAHDLVLMPGGATPEAMPPEEPPGPPAASP